MPDPLKRLIIFGDNSGIPQTLEHLDLSHVVALVGASIRPQYQVFLRDLAREISVPCIVQPKVSDKIAYSAFTTTLKNLKPDGIICNSYAMLIRQDVLDLVEGNAFNLHSALLPRHRGPNPVQWAIIHGDTESGVTLHLMDGEFDCGAIVDQVKTPIDLNDTWLSLTEKLAIGGRIVLARAIPRLISGNWESHPQDEQLMVQNSRIAPDSFPVIFAEMNDTQIFNLIRAQISPLSGAYLDTPQGRIRFKDYLPLSSIGDVRKKYE